MLGMFGAKFDFFEKKNTLMAYTGRAVGSLFWKMCVLLSRHTLFFSSIEPGRLFRLKFENFHLADYSQQMFVCFLQESTSYRSVSGIQVKIRMDGI
jgi:hypothetical protein